WSSDVCSSDLSPPMYQNRDRVVRAAKAMDKPSNATTRKTFALVISGRSRGAIYSSVTTTVGVCMVKLKFPKSIQLAGITVSVSLVRMSQGTEFPPLDKGDRMNNPDRDKRINKVIAQKVTRSGRVQDFKKKSSFI